jgi:hypothetical protein
MTHLSFLPNRYAPLFSSLADTWVPRRRHCLHHPFFPKFRRGPNRDRDNLAWSIQRFCSVFASPLSPIRSLLSRMHLPPKTLAKPPPGCSQSEPPPHRHWRRSSPLPVSFDLLAPLVYMSPSLSPSCTSLTWSDLVSCSRSCWRQMKLRWGIAGAPVHLDSAYFAIELASTTWTPG